MEETSVTAFIVLVSAMLWHVGGVNGVDRYHRFCYLDTMAQLRQGAGRFALTDLDDVTLCTHIVFVHAGVDPVNFDLEPALQDDFAYYQELTDLKTVHPDLKVLLLVGGLDMQTSASLSQDSAAFSVVVNDTDSVNLFADNVVIYLRKFGFDGLELDWRYPGIYGSDPDDVYRFTVLVRTLSERFDEDYGGSPGSERLMLNVRVTGDRYLLENTVQLEEIVRYVDFLIVTAYDFYVTEATIGHNSGLLGRNGDANAYATLNADYIVQYLTQYREVPASRIILGVPTFGRTNVFINESLQAFGVPHGGTGPSGPYTAQPGVLAYYEICSLLRNGWTEISDGEQMTPFAFSDEEIVTYDNTFSVAAKANYIKDQRLAGAALWDLSYDDFSGVFCDDGRFPLASSLRTTLTSPRSSCKAGQRGELDVPGCEPCPLGTFQPSANTMTCLQCPQGLTTLTDASTEEYQCILSCSSGSEYNYVTLSCEPCPLGYYRQEGRDPACLKCAPGHTTVATSSTDCVRRPAGVPETTPRQIDVRVNVTFAAVSCENKPVIVGALRMLVTDYFMRLAQVWAGLCDDPSCDNVKSDVIQGCDGGDVREKRQAEERLLVSIFVGNVSEEVSDSESTRQTQNVIAAALNERKEFQPLSTYGIRLAKLESLKTNLVCEPGFAEKNSRCEQCEAGTFHNSSGGTCTPCPQGYYQDLEGQAGCWPCPAVMTTVTSGVSSPDGCVSPCEARSNYCLNGGSCHWSDADKGSVLCECHYPYHGDRCEEYSETPSANSAGTIVGAVVGGVLAFLIIILIIVACCVCFRMRRTMQLNHLQQGSNSTHSSNNHYMSWGTFSKGSMGHRGVKFVDYIDYYSWLNTLSDYQRNSKSSSNRKTRTTQQQTSSPVTVVAATQAEPLPQQSTINICTSNGGANSFVAETNIDSVKDTDQK